MSAPAAISGDFATYRHVQGRKVLQLVIEVPAESAASVFAALGTPGAGEGIPVALARLAKRSEAQQPPKERRPFTELPYAQQAAIRCEEAAFSQFLAHTHSTEWRTAAQIAGDPSVKWAPFAVRLICEVSSRSEIIKGTPAGDRWAALEADFYAWQRGRR